MTSHFCILILATTLLASCSSKTTESTGIINKVDASDNNTSDEVDDGAELFDASGQNRQPIFISEDEMTFISHARKSHKKGQLYVANLKTKEKRRITHQLGEVTNGGYSKKNKQFFYSSTIDEKKNLSDLVTNFISKEAQSSGIWGRDLIENWFYPQEVYSVDRNSTKITRITNNRGFDGFPTINDKRKQIIFSRKIGKHVQLLKKSLTSKRKPKTISRRGYHHFNVASSPKGNEVLWSRIGKDLRRSQIMQSHWSLKKPKVLLDDEGVHWGPQWHPKGKWLVFSSNKPGSLGFDIFAMKTDGKCLTPITKKRGDDFFPHFSPDGKTLAFTSTRSGKEQIYFMLFQEPSCVEEKSQGVAENL